MSYVNLHATRIEYDRVLARLATTNPLPPMDSCPSKSASSTLPHRQQPTPAGPWGNLLASLFGGLQRNTASTHTKGSPTDHDTAYSHDNGSPLSRAVVMFTATWCGPCSMVHKELKQAVRKLDGRPACAIIVVDVEENQELASELGIKALPTLLYLGRDGARGPIYTQGPVSASAILDTMDRAASLGGRDLAARWLKL